MSSAIATVDKCAQGQNTQENNPSVLETVPGPCDDKVRLRAYEKWEAAGRPSGNEVGYWLEAEQELLHAE